MVKEDAKPYFLTEYWIRGTNQLLGGSLSQSKTDML